MNALIPATGPARFAWQIDGYGHGADAALAAEYAPRPAGSLIAVPACVPRAYVNTWAEAWEHGYAETAWQCGAP
jgi:hypothetical protein